MGFNTKSIKYYLEEALLGTVLFLTERRIKFLTIFGFVLLISIVVKNQYDWTQTELSDFVSVEARITRKTKAKSGNVLVVSFKKKIYRVYYTSDSVYSSVKKGDRIKLYHQFLKDEMHYYLPGHLRASSRE